MKSLFCAGKSNGDPNRKTDIIYDLDIKDHLSANMRSAVDCFIFTNEETVNKKPLLVQYFQCICGHMFCLFVCSCCYF